MRRGKWTMMAAVVLLAGTLTARAAWQPIWEPRGWVYFDWPYAYDTASGTWIYFDEKDMQWCFGYAPVNSWAELDASGLAHGWSYHAWPYAYDNEGGAWYYMNEVDTQWCYNLGWSEWSELQACAVGYNSDCRTQCGPSSWIGDGWCDDGQYGVYFNCAAFSYDQGDCLK